MNINQSQSATFNGEIKNKSIKKEVLINYFEEKSLRVGKGDHI